MTTINTTQSGQGAAAAALASSNPDGTDTAAGTEDRFLKLLVAQMRNQDPLNPLDNAEVTSQLAQINTVRGIEQLNRSMAAVAGASTTVSPMAAVGMLGREVLIAGEVFDWAADPAAVADPDPATDDLPATAARPARLGFELPASASAVRIEVLDGAGQVVHVHALADVEAGVHSFSWDGRDADGRTVGDGKYRLRASAAAYDSTELPVETLVSARVTGVAQAPGGARVELGGRPAQAASAVRAIL